MSDQLANQAWEALMTAHARLLRQFAADDWEDLSMREYDVLYTLSKCPEPVRMSELGQHVLLSQPGLSRLVDRLVQRGFVERSADPADGRSVRVGLAPSGAARQKKVGRRHARAVAQAMVVLDPAEQRQLLTLAGKLAGTAAPVPEIPDRVRDDGGETPAQPHHTTGDTTAQPHHVIPGSDPGSLR